MRNLLLRILGVLTLIGAVVAQSPPTSTEPVTAGTWLSISATFAVEFAPLEGSFSPDRRVAIRENPKRHYEFVDVRSGKGVGRIEAAENRNKIDFVTSWNSDSTRVALLMYYGTKLSGLMVFQRSPQSRFVELGFRCPDPVKAYLKERGSLPFPENSGGMSCNDVGPWLTKSTVRLFAGEANEQADSGVLLVSFEVHVTKGVASIINVHLHGPMTYTESESFFHSNGARQ